jgi:hypothetical protein
MTTPASAPLSARRIAAVDRNQRAGDEARVVTGEKGDNRRDLRYLANATDRVLVADRNTGKNTYKAVQRSAGAVTIGPVLQGLNKPVNDLSHGCTVTVIVNAVSITAVQAQSGDAP